MEIRNSSDEATSPLVVSKRSRKDERLNLRKSIAWNPAFFTEEGVLDACDLPILTDSVNKPSSKIGSSMLQFDKCSKRPPLNNLEENFLSEVCSSSMCRSSNKMAANLLSISEASKRDGCKMPMTLMKMPSAKGITRNVRKVKAACLMLEKEKAAKVQPEKDTTISKLNSHPSSSNRSQRKMSSTPIQAKQSSLKIPSSHGILKIFEKDPILLKLNSRPSSSIESPMDTTCFGSARTFSSISQKTVNVPGLPPAPIQAKPSALRKPSPSLGFFQPKMVTSSHNNDLRKTSQVQQTISRKSQTGQVPANSSADVQLAASEECQPHDDFQLRMPRNETSSVEDNALMPVEKESLDKLKQDTVLLKHHLSAVPYSEEWLAAIEAFGEDILEVKTGTVHNSPPDKEIPEAGPWSPVNKRKAQDVGPFDCTKYTLKPFLREEE